MLLLNFTSFCFFFGIVVNGRKSKKKNLHTLNLCTDVKNDRMTANTNSENLDRRHGGFKEHVSVDLHSVLRSAHLEMNENFDIFFPVNRSMSNKQSFWFGNI